MGVKARIRDLHHQATCRQSEVDQLVLQNSELSRLLKDASGQVAELKAESLQFASALGWSDDVFSLQKEIETLQGENNELKDKISRLRLQLEKANSAWVATKSPGSYEDAFLQEPMKSMREASDIA